jgi:hemoglobin-like flavoprotein
MITFGQNEFEFDSGAAAHDGMKTAVTRKKSSPGRGSRRRASGFPQKPSISRLTAKQIHLLRESFARIEPQAGIASLIFYRHLFTLDPKLRPLFHTSIELQGRKLMEALSYTVSSLEDPEALVPVLESLGRRHVTYGTRDEHYATVHRALMQALEETLGKSFTAETRKAWNVALEFVAETMKRGARPLKELQAE